MNDDERTRDLGKGRGAFDTGETLPAAPPELGALATPERGAPPPPSSPALRVGTRVGRYLLEEELGRGGMGVVYAAHDPELDRRVAIKLLRTAAVEGAEGKARLQREAQALARLAHPNVISVFDVGQVGDDVFVAMELSSGGTLRAWQAGKSWRELIAAYGQAGRGLHAAHAAGLVHRDFKPDNVLVGADGRMRVTDFGLVRAAESARTPPIARTPRATPVESPTESGRQRALSNALSSDLTEAGSVMGTPLYMAPEQMTGGAVDAAADQFAFCVALWQALHGESPFPAFEMKERLAQIQRGERVPPRQRAVPATINRALVRGLSFEPGARWPSLDALLDALDAAARPRRGWLAIGAAVLVVGGGGAALALALTGRSEAPCAQAAAGADVWSSKRAAVEAAFQATGAPFAADAFRFVDQRLGGFERELGAQRIATCQDTRVRHTQTAAVAEVRQACLGARQHRAAALVDVLGRADRTLLERIDEVVASLPSLDACADLETLAGKTPRPVDPAAARALSALEETIATVDAKLSVFDSRLDDVDAGPGRTEAQAAADAAVAAADQLGYPPAQSEVRLVRAHVARTYGDPDASRKDLIEAAAAATRGNDRQRLAEAYLDLLFLDSQVRADWAGAEQWSQLAGAAVDALGSPIDKKVDLVQSRAEVARGKGDPRAAVAPLEALLADPAVTGNDALDLQSTLVLTYIDLGEFDKASALLDGLIKAWTASLGPDHPKVLSLRANRANLLYFAGDFTGCRDAHREILGKREVINGPNSPAVANSLDALGACENKAGEAETGRDHLERSVAIFKAVRGPTHPDTLAAMSDLAGSYSALGDHAHALTINQELLAIRERTTPKDHPDLGISLVNIGIEAKNAGQVALAISYQERAIGIFERALGVDHPNVGLALINYAESLRAAGRNADAVAALERAERIIRAGFGADHVLMAHVWYGLGQAELGRGRARAAVTWLEKAVGRRTGAEIDPNEIAEAELALAQALVASGGSRPRARTLAEHALSLWGPLGAGFADERAAAQAWLAKVRP